jgi:hypothetical protein
MVRWSISTFLKRRVFAVIAQQDFLKIRARNWALARSSSQRKISRIDDPSYGGGANAYAGRKVLQIRNGKIINEFRAAALEFLHHAVGAVYDTRTRLVLAIAEVARKAIETDMAEQIRNALDLAGRWEQSSDVPGAALSNAVEGESGNDDNLAVEMGEAPELQKPAWVALASAILYTSWHAYLADSDKKVMTETVSEVNEEVIDEVVDYAGRVPGFDLRLVDRLAQHCLDHHRTSDASESIPREVMLQVATATD